MKKETPIMIIIILFLSYLLATIIKSDLSGNLMSPIMMIGVLSIVFHAFCYKERNKNGRIVGLFLSLGVLFWVIADLLWAFYDIIFNLDPQNVTIITFCYAIPNLFIALSLTIYGYQVFRKWNVVQLLLNSIVISFFVIELIWIIFLKENVENIVILKSDWISTSCILLDVWIIIWIVIWYMSVRNGKIPMYIRLLATGILLYAITDLVYYYQYFYGKYEPNSIIDAVYISSFLFMSLAASVKMNSKNTDIHTVLYNTNQKGKGYFLLLGPILLIIFEGIVVTHLLQFVSIILIYNMLSGYIQKNIYKEGLLRKEQEYTNELEQKVKLRTEELEESNRVLYRLLDQDFVTGLKNRRYLLTYLDKMIAALKDGETIVLLYIDINRFKMISTMYGHYIGDMILYEMAEKLIPLEKLAVHKVLTSYGDDTFIFAAVGHYDYNQGYEFAQKAIRLCSDIYQIEEYQIRVTVNVGISIYPNDSTTKEELIKHADIAMSQARRQGFNYVKEFDANLSKAIFRKNTIEIMLKKVNFNQEFMIYYQPQLLTDSKKLIGFEALLRWKTSTGEMIGPAEFIPVAEETGYINPIGDWVMTGALKQLVIWNRNFEEKIMVGINVSIKQLNSLEFVDDLQRQMQLLEVEPEWIDLEITESFLLYNNPEVLPIMEGIRKLGVRISIDDFGTGYSSLSYFKNLPIDRIKIAKELVDYVHIDDFDYKLVEAIILLSKARGITVIAEGVETEEQWLTLKQLQCDEVQGYYFGRPEPASVVEEAFGLI